MNVNGITPNYSIHYSGSGPRPGLDSAAGLVPGAGEAPPERKDVAELQNMIRERQGLSPEERLEQVISKDEIVRILSLAGRTPSSGSEPDFRRVDLLG